MCNVAGVLFGVQHLTPAEVKGQRTLEVGSLDVNGSWRTFLTAWQPAEYVGVDIVPGPGVDRLVAVEDLVNVFGEKSFDLVVATELLEHVFDWRAAVSNLKRVIGDNGKLLLTTRSRGFPYHGYPDDFWRYEKDDLKKIFADLSIEALEIDSSAPGVFLKARKPLKFKEIDLATYQLYSLITGSRIVDLKPADRQTPRYLALFLKGNIKKLISRTFWLKRICELVGSLACP